MNVINLTKQQPKTETAELSFEEIIKKNKENNERLRKERLEANKKVVKDVKRTSNKK